LGVEASASAEFSADRVGVQLDFGATLGIGAEVGIDVRRPLEVVDTVSDALSDLNPSAGDRQSEKEHDDARDHHDH
jgi:hypothetical protein